MEENVQNTKNRKNPSPKSNTCNDMHFECVENTLMTFENYDGSCIVEKKHRESVVDIHEAPEWLRDNEFIKRGYRIHFTSFTKITKSLFMYHNESVNVWSHLLGAMFVVILVLYTSLYLESKSESIYAVFDEKWNQFNEDFDQFTNQLPSLENITHNMEHTYQETKEKFNNYTASLKNRTINYFHSLEDKLQNYYGSLFTKRFR